MNERVKIDRLCLQGASASLVDTREGIRLDKTYSNVLSCGTVQLFSL